MYCLELGVIHSAGWYNGGSHQTLWVILEGCFSESLRCREQQWFHRLHVIRVVCTMMMWFSLRSSESLPSTTGTNQKKINLYNQLDFILDISILRLPGGQDKMLTFNISSLWWPKQVIEDTISLSSLVGGAHVQELPKILKLLQTKTSRWKLHLSWIWPVSFVCSPGAQ